MHRNILMLALAIGLVAILACEEDDPVEVVPPVSDGFQSLTTRSAVLNNIEAAYNNRRLDKYDELLDDNFTFFLSNGDVGHGLPPSWGRLDELTANANLFAQDPGPSYPRCKSIQMDIDLEQSLVWAEDESPSVPGELWYTTTVYYDFKFEVEPDMNYLSLPTAKATFTLRNAGTDDAPHWQLVEMRDLSDESAATSFAASTESKTWGSVKAIYR